MSVRLEQQIQARWNSRTKPVRSLGRLEDIVTQYCLLRGDALPPRPVKGLYVFAGDHGVCEEGVSAYPSAVTAQMVANILAGGAAVNALARHHQVSVELIDCGVGRPTRNFARESALSQEQLDRHLQAGVQLAHEAKERFTLVGVGEMGIGNTTSASAISAALLGMRPIDVTGPGTGLDYDGVAHKVRVIERALERHQLSSHDARGVLEAVGGHEIARMAGFLIGAAQAHLPVMLDGFITAAAALAACRLDSTVRANLSFSHLSEEKGHQFLMDAMAGEALLDLGLRLGEGTGAILGMSLLESAWRIYAEMASFESARVSGPLA